MHAPSLIDARHPNGVIIRLYDTSGSTLLEQRLLTDELDDDMVDELAALTADLANNALWADKDAVTLAGYDGDTGELMMTATVAK